MKTILGIESSCDDTGVAIITSSREILSNIVISQDQEHKLYQGVVPEIAARSHMQNLDKAIKEALSEAKLELHNIDAISATSGPGLIGGVIVGCMYGKALSSTLKKPFIAINHLEGHALTVRLTDATPYPYLLLLASGGHCQFVAVLGLSQYKILGQTLDDSVGEAFDKVAKMMGLGFPGGPIIEKLAKLGDPDKYILPKPIINQNNCDMSFSGLKTAVRLLISKIGKLSEQDTYDIAASFQYTAAEILSIKSLKAIEAYEVLSPKPLYNLVVAGGVASNQYIRRKIQQKVSEKSYNLIAPPIKLCTDNAAMIAYAGLERFEANLINDLNFCPKARWGLEEIC